MDSQPGAVDWELIVGRDLIPHLLSARRPRGVYRPADVTWLPEGAYTAIVESIGRVGPTRMAAPSAAVWIRGRCCLTAATRSSPPGGAHASGAVNACSA